MISRAFRLSAAAILLLSAAPQAGDTTYSETRSLPRESSSSGGNRSGRSSSDDDGRGWHFHSEDDEDGPRFTPHLAPHQRGGMLESCLSQESTLSTLLLYPMIAGTCWGFYGIGVSVGHLFSGDAEMEPMRSERWRVGMGFGLGGMWLTEGAGGATLVPHVEVLHALSPGHQVGLRAGFGMALEASTRDYARTAFTEGRAIGEEFDRIAYYDHHAVPVILEYHRTSASGLSLSVGVGAEGIRERIDYIRTRSWQGGERELTEERIRVRPLAGIALGRFGSRDGRVKSRFGFRYQAAFLLPARRSSFPGDNADIRHSLTWDWSWLI